MSKLSDNFKNKNFFLLWLAQVISQFGDRINQMALIGLIAGRTPGSAFQLAKLLSFTIIPVFIIGPIAGVYVDRWDRRTTLFVCDFLRALLVLTIPFIFIEKGSMIPIYIVVFLTFCLSRFYVPAKMSIIPDLVHEKDLLMANSLVTTTGMIAFTLGCALGGFLVEKFGAKGGFICDAATFFISGVLVFTINHKVRFRIKTSELIGISKEVIGVIRKSVFTEIKEGLAYLTNHKDIRFIINMLFILFSAAGAIYVVIIVFIQDVFNSITKDLGLLAVFLGLGLFSGSLLYGRFGEKISRFTTIFLCLIFGGIMLIIFSVMIQNRPSLFLAAVLTFILGLIVGPIMIAANTVIHQVSDENMRGKVFSSLEIVVHFAFLLSMIVSSLLAEHIERFWILVAVGIIFAFVGLVGLLRYNRTGILTAGSVTK